MNSNENWAWIDVETDGTDASTGHLLEIAVVVTDTDLNILDPKGFHAIVGYTPEDVAWMQRDASPIVLEMHTKTGLWDKLSSDQGQPLARIDVNLKRYLKRFGQERTMPVAGNSVRLDMNFVDEFLPESAAYLDYHMRDVSTVAGLAADWYNAPWFQKRSDHTAALDIRESIRELKHFRKLIFKEQAEPVSETQMTLDRIRAIYDKAQAEWPEVEGDEQYIALGTFLSDLEEVFG